MQSVLDDEEDVLCIVVLMVRVALYFVCAWSLQVVSWIQKREREINKVRLC